MLVNYSVRSGEHVKFVSYSGRYPNLCSGVLVLEIDGENVVFGIDYTRNWEEQLKDPCVNQRFWSSGGGLTADYDTYQAEWEIDVNKLPDQYKKYADEIDRVFNMNVEYGCCGGCA